MDFKGDSSCQKWNSGDINCLLDLVLTNQDKLDTWKKNQTFKYIAAELNKKRNRNFNGSQCKFKLNNLKATYRRIRDHNKVKGNEFKHWEHFDRVHEICSISILDDSQTKMTQNVESINKTLYFQDMRSYNNEKSSVFQKSVLKKRKKVLTKITKIPENTIIEDDEIDKFGSYIVASLKKLPVENYIKAEEEIQSVLTKYKLLSLVHNEQTMIMSTSSTPEDDSVIEEISYEF